MQSSKVANRVILTTKFRNWHFTVWDRLQQNFSFEYCALIFHPVIHNNQCYLGAYAFVPFTLAFILFNWETVTLSPANG